MISSTTSDDALSTTPSKLSYQQLMKCHATVQCCLKNSPKTLTHFAFILEYRLSIFFRKIYEYIFSITMDCVLTNYTISVHTGKWLASHVTVRGTVSILCYPPPPLLSFISCFVTAPCLWNLQMTMTGTIRETKQNGI